ncbi:MAG: PTS system mannose/fructose/sorbose family transporter subunit IID [Deltaproteobacteria bacterium]|nr:PTS system mannose/fructose/sorbose family transporter subunit IID [Deltaproteobacteria bacterium]
MSGKETTGPGDAKSINGSGTGFSLAVRIFLRSLIMQASWSYAGMQKLGFLFCLVPLARQIKNPSDRSSLLKRHNSFFNSHPYLSGGIIASAARNEALLNRGGIEEALRLKSALMGPYAAIGDPFFWGALRPLAAYVAIAAAWCASGSGIAGIFATFLLYTVVHCMVRLGAFIEGYRKGKGALEFLGRLKLPRWTKRLKAASIFPLAVIAIAAPGLFPGFDIPGGPVLGGVATAACIIAAYRLILWRLPVLAILYGGSLLCIFQAM